MDEIKKKNKNIVLLSDGTGNSAAKLFKTNVWRVYDALDLRNPELQVACYDDGVGTSAFRPLALLGGAIGFGLKRNVLRLYRFLCEQYEPGDRIYAFGFSRGAFTIRVLAALVADQGIVRVRADKFVEEETTPPGSEVVAPIGERGAGMAEVVAAPVRTTMTASELRRLAKRAYQHFRHNFDQTLPIVWLGRWLRDHSFALIDAWGGREPYKPEWNYHLEKNGITFVGVWDTVDAYGLPVDELTEGVNRWIWPLSLPEFALSDTVAKACHAVSLDDERHTFHPVLWDESKEPQDKTRIEDERVSQVWFAGVHANVGGGYANDALSAVSLEWVATEATKKDLRFLPDRLASWIDRRDPLGAGYDSRRGIAAYYRYSPRRVQHLTNGQRHERTFRGGTWPDPTPTVTIGRPKIHESVFERIEAAADFYAPIGLPADYAIVTKMGNIVAGAGNEYETPDQSTDRFDAQESVWDLVWWRRIVYFAGVAVTAVFVVWPLRDAAEATAEIAARGGGLRLIAMIGSFLPEAASAWVNYYSAAPWELAAGLGALGAILLAGRTLRSRIADRMHTIWRWVMAPREHPDLRLPARRGIASFIRTRKHYHGVFSVFRRIVIPHTFGPLVLLWLLAGVNRLAFEAPNLLGGACTPSGATSPVGAGVVQHSFPTSSFCEGTGLALARGGQYELSAAFAGAQDDTIPVTRADGFGLFSPGLTIGQRALFALGFPFKRLLRADWFGVVGRVGQSGVEQFPLAAGTVRFTARNDGELFVFVNDAIVPLAPFGGTTRSVGWSSAYTNNQGTATVTIRRID